MVYRMARLSRKEDQPSRKRPLVGLLPGRLVPQLERGKAMTKHERAIRVILGQVDLDERELLRAVLCQLSLKKVGEILDRVFAGEFKH